MQQLRKKDFLIISKARYGTSIDGDRRLRNLAQGYWVYDELLMALLSNGWVRFAAGFKAGVYAHPAQPWVIKIMGMGVGDAPSYFAERGYYLEHERGMLQAFRLNGLTFGPAVLPLKDTVSFLQSCGVSPHQAELRACRHDLLVMEKLEGIPFATQTGHFLAYEPDIAVFDSGLLREAEHALRKLKAELSHANTLGLLHNDPMPANILFVLNENHELRARLVDFELAQDVSGFSAPYVSESVQELYAQRDVPRNAHSNTYIKNLDEHIMEQTLSAFRELRKAVEDLEDKPAAFDWLSISVSFLAGFSINVGKAIQYCRDRYSANISSRRRPAKYRP